MVIGEKIIPLITEFVDELDGAIAQQKSQKRLSKTQKYWLSFCLMAILATKSGNANEKSKSFGRRKSHCLWSVKTYT